MRIVISSEVEKSSLQTDKGRAKVERGSTQVLFSWDDDTEKPYFQQARDQPRPKEGARMVNDVPSPPRP